MSDTITVIPDALDHILKCKILFKFKKMLEYSSGSKLFVNTEIYSLYQDK